MNFKILIGILLVASAINAQATQLEIIQSINFARTNPAAVIGSLTNRIKRTGKKGTTEFPNCWQEAVDALRNQKPVLPIREEIGLDMAAYTQSKDMFENIRALKHLGSDKSTVEQRMKRYGKFTGNYLFYEMLSYFKQTKAVSADKIVHLFITDCSNKDKTHRKLIFDTSVTQMGASVFYSNKQTWVTILASKNFKSNAVTNKQMAEAWIDGNGQYTGNGQAHPTAKWHYASDFIKRGEEIFNQELMDGVDKEKNELLDAKDDGSTKCPSYINPEKLAVRVIKKWRLISGTCNRMDDEWNYNGHFIKRTLPFAKNDKCYHRLSFCNTDGKIYAQDWEYKTWKTASTEDETLKNIQKMVVKDDLSVKCPSFINADLEIKTINNWYHNGEKCTRGKNGYAESGFFRIRPYAQNKKCYHQLKFCSANGLVWLKDTEYKTFDAWKAAFINSQ